MLFDETDPAAAPAEYGWAVASRTLVLAGGRRTVTLSIRFAEEAGCDPPDLRPFAEDSDSFILQLSGSEGWRRRAYVIDGDAAGRTLRFTFTIDDDEEAPAPCTAELHGFADEYPALRILFADRTLPERLLAGLRIERIGIAAEAEGIRDFTLTGESGRIDASQPFYPFGALGERGGRILIGHDETAGKNISAITLKGIWTRLPEEGFAPIYAGYGTAEPVGDGSFRVRCEWRREGRWIACADACRPLFRTDAAGRLAEEALFELRPEDTPETRPAGDSADEATAACFIRGDGLYRMTLTDPRIGFGMNAYYRRFTEVMMHNGREKEKNRLAVPEQPQVPMLCDMTFGYRSEETVYPGGRLSRYTGLRGYEPCMPAEEELPVFLPEAELPALEVELTDLGDTGVVRLYIDLRRALQGRRPAAARPSGSLTASRYAGNGVWRELSDEEMTREETCGLTRSGFIEIDTSACGGADGMWLRFTFPDGLPPEETSLAGIYPNALRVTAVGGDGSPLPAGTITAPAEPDARIRSVCQPAAGCGGLAAETDADVGARLRIRISTRNRAVCCGNYEELILQRFPEVAKVCCIPAAEPGDGVRIVVFPEPEPERYPGLPGWLLTEIEEYIRRCASPFAAIRVTNPVFEGLRIVFTAVLKRETRDREAVRQRTERRIRDFLTPWYMYGTIPEPGASYACDALLARIINDACIEEFVSIEIVSDGWSRRITKEEQADEQVLRPADRCGILFIERLEIVLTESLRGVNEARIGSDFIIR